MKPSPEVSAYIAALDEPKRSTLEETRRRIGVIIPGAEECISYNVPAFRLDGRIVAGFAAFKSHLSYLPFSGSVLPALSNELMGYEGTKSALHFPIDQPLAEDLLRTLIMLRIDERRR
jgi:uncharacterized protein YdhG (YjbR/CyaY superfamily)